MTLRPKRYRRLPWQRIGPRRQMLLDPGPELPRCARQACADPSPQSACDPRKPQRGRNSLDLLKWGLIPYWCADPKGGRKPINAKSETVAKLPMFRDSYRRRRFILPIDAFYEWRANKGGKQPYAIAMKHRSPFGIAGWPPRTYEPRCEGSDYRARRPLSPS